MKGSVYKTHDAIRCTVAVMRPLRDVIGEVVYHQGQVESIETNSVQQPLQHLCCVFVLNSNPYLNANRFAEW